MVVFLQDTHEETNYLVDVFSLCQGAMAGVVVPSWPNIVVVYSRPNIVVVYSRPNIVVVYSWPNIVVVYSLIRIAWWVI